MNTREFLTRAADICGVSLVSLTSPMRGLPGVRARFATALALREAGLTLSQIGRILGGRDHSTILHAIRQAVQLRERDPEFAALCTALQVEIGADELALEERPEKVLSEVVRDLVALAKENPAGFRKLMTRAGSYDPAHYL